MTDDQMEKKRAILDAFVKNLKPHFDSIRVFATKHDDEGERTFSFDRGLGNLKAQEGQVREWLINQEAMVKRYGWDHAYEIHGDSEGDHK